MLAANASEIFKIFSFFAFDRLHFNNIVPDSKKMALLTIYESDNQLKIIDSARQISRIPIDRWLLWWPLPIKKTDPHLSRPALGIVKLIPAAA